MAIDRLQILKSLFFQDLDRFVDEWHNCIKRS